MSPVLKNYLVIIAALFLAVSCKKQEQEIPVNSALYDVTIKGMWSQANHPIDYPSNSHFSSIVGMVHNQNANLFEVDKKASEGIKEMAERGKTEILNNEIDALLQGGNVGSRVNGTGISSGSGSGIATLQVTSLHPLVSLVSMLAPSPDWFIGIQNLNLLRNGEFVTDTILSIAVYDAGTDSGVSFTSSNKATNPRENIIIIVSPPLGNGVGVKPEIASISLVKRN